MSSGGVGVRVLSPAHLRPERNHKMLKNKFPHLYSNATNSLRVWVLSAKVFALILIVASALVTSAEKTFAATLYSVTGTGTNVTSVSAGSNDGLSYTPGYTGSGSWISSPSFYTATADIYYLEVVRVSGNTCEEMRQSGREVSVRAGGTDYVVQSAETLSDGSCRFGLGANKINSGSQVHSVNFFNQDASSGSDPVFMGSVSNLGYYWNDIDATFVSSGGPAFRLCDLSGCTGSLVPPSVSITFPEDSSSGVSDFSQWQVTKTGTFSENYVIGLHYSTDEDIVIDCEDFPSGPTSGYTECINSDPRIWVDYSPVFSGGASGVFPITKNTPFTIGQTYYAQAVLQEDDAFGAPLYVSSVVSFTIGVPSDSGLQQQTCTTFDIACHLRNWAIWAFIPAEESMDQFTSLTLVDRVPFSYIADLDDLYDDLFSQSTDDLDISITTSIGTLTLISKDMLEAVPFQGLILTILSSMMWFFTALTIYRIIYKIHDK